MRRNEYPLQPLDSSEIQLVVNETEMKNGNKLNRLIALAIVICIAFIGCILVTHFVTKNQYKNKNDALNKLPKEDVREYVCTSPNRLREYQLLYCDKSFTASTSKPDVILSTTPHEETTPSLVTVTGEPEQNETIKTILARLPRDVMPIEYDIFVSVDFRRVDTNKQYPFSGKTTVVVECKKVTDEILLNVLDLTIENVVIRLVGSTDDLLKEYEVHNDEQFISVKTKNKLTIDKKYEIIFTFTSLLNRHNAGLYYSSYKENAMVHHIAATQMEPVDARRMFPCFDEPDMKANFTISVEHETTYGCISNMKKKSEDNSENGMKITKFKKSPKMSTYLVALVISKFDVLEGKTRSDVNIRVWCQKLKIKSAEFPLQLAIKLTDKFGEYYKTPFPLEKQDMIALPDFSEGAMENWGLITYRESRLLVDEATSSTLDKQYVAQVVSHELAHQWFGNLVTPKWWDDLWLNEGFARYIEYWGVNDLYPEYEMMNQFIIKRHLDVMLIDGKRNSHPVTVPVKQPMEINEIFDSISYSKGASMIRMMVNFLSEEMVRNGLQYYLSTYAYDNTDQYHLWSSMDHMEPQGLPDTVREIMKRWTNQMGFPIIHFNSETDELTQHRFIYPTSNQNESSSEIKYPSAYNYEWIIPIHITTDLDNKIIWLKDKKMTIETEDLDKKNFYLFNADAFAFIRVKYDEKNYQQITKRLKEDHHQFSVGTRAQLLSDASELAAAYEIDMKIFLEMTLYLAKPETHSGIWDLVAGNLVDINARLRPFKSYELFQNYLKYITKPILLNVGWEPKPTDEPLDTYVRNTILMLNCKIHQSECREYITKLFNKWKSDPTNNPIPPDQRDLVYCFALRLGNSSDWHFLLNNFLNSDNLPISELNKQLLALPCTREPWLLEKLLKEAIVTKQFVRLQDSLSVIIKVAKSPYGSQLAWKYVKKYYKQLYESLGQTGGFGRMIRAFAEVFSDEGMKQEFVELGKMAKLNNMEGTAAIQFQAGIDNIDLNIGWLKKIRPQIEDWLQKNFDGNSTLQPIKNDIRLSKDIIPISYTIELEPFLNEDDENAYKFNGKNTITFECEKPTKTIELHWKNLMFRENLTTEEPATNVPVPREVFALKEVANGEEVQIVSWKKNPRNDILTLRLDNILKKNGKYNLMVKYDGIINDLLAGWYKAKYTNSKGIETYLATSHCQPANARKIFPCFDEPELKAKIILTVTHDKELKCLSNGKLETSKEVGEDKLESSFETTPKMSTYLFAIVVGDVECKNETVKSANGKDVEISACAEPEKIEGVSYALEIATKVLPYYEKLFNIPYPLSKMHMLAVSAFNAGAMENWGLIIYRETAMLYDPTVNSISNKYRVAEVVAHEWAHQWFGNLVTPKWWDEIWLNEGFASFMEYLGVDESEKLWKAQNRMVTTVVQTIMEDDAVATSLPVYRPIHNVDEVNQAFDYIVYDKGCSILRMLKGFLTKDVFYEGISEYLKEFLYSATVGEELWSSLTKTAHEKNFLPADKNVSSIMHNWIQKSGFPVINVKQLENNKVQLKQRRYLSTTLAKNDETLWQVPITYRIIKNANREESENIVWLDDKEAEYDWKLEKESVVILNRHHDGFYRVNYDKENWMKITEYLQTNPEEFEEIEKSLLFDDSLSLFISGHINPKIPFDLLQYLKNGTETSSNVARTLVYKFSTINDKLYFQPSYQSFKKLIRSYFNSYYSDNLFDFQPTNDINQVDFQRYIVSLSCGYNVEGCRSEARRRYLEWRTNGTEINSNVRTIVLCYGAIKEGTSEDWEYIKGRYMEEKNAAEKSKFGAALGCTNSMNIVRRLLTMSTNGEIKNSEISTVIGYASNSPMSNGVVLQYVLKNWKLYFDKFRDDSFTLDRIIQKSCLYLSSQCDITILQDFMDSNQVGPAKQAFINGIEKIRYSINWLEEVYPKLEDYLRKFEDSSIITT
ncbi:hypothetical protein SNEBB_007304 [Seison nebaliae]|nr:hypothetical protein SNEBB_007304 [Seison nebaliae]